MMFARIIRKKKKKEQEVKRIYALKTPTLPIAFPAIYWLALGGLEWHLTVLAALRAFCLVQLSLPKIPSVSKAFSLVSSTKFSHF